jgi:inward rectifier potassium channel
VWRHWLDPAGIGGGAVLRASFAEAFFFSVQTLGSIGFGVRSPPRES